MSRASTPASPPCSQIILPAGSDAGLAWLAGLLEGEGYFHVVTSTTNGKKYRYPKIAVGMTDRDVIERAAVLLGGNQVIPLSPSKPGYKPKFLAVVSGWAAAELMRQMRPWVGSRRGAASDRRLAEYYPRKLAWARRRRAA